MNPLVGNAVCSHENLYTDFGAEIKNAALLNDGVN